MSFISWLPSTYLFQTFVPPFLHIKKEPDRGAQPLRPFPWEGERLKGIYIPVACRLKA